MNWFDSRQAAEWYAMGRPYYHEQVIAEVVVRLSLHEPVERALDVGCGTGLSTRALRRLAKHVIGTDISAEMIAQATPMDGVTYRVGPGESLPVPDAAFDIVTIASAFHWLNRDRFFAEVRRILKPDGVLVIYENGFYGQMGEEPAFAEWVKAVHLTRYPSPPRNAPFAYQPDDPAGFALVATERYENDVEMTLAQFVAYLLTQSNAIAIIESGRETPEQVRDFLAAELAPFFAETDKTCGTTTRRLLFGGVYWILRRTEES